MWKRKISENHRIVKLWMWCAEVVERRNTLRKSVSRLNIPHIHSEVPEASNKFYSSGEPLILQQ